MPRECPMCGEPASATAEVKSGNSWKDTFGKPPHSLFNQYKMIHIADAPGGNRLAFLHSESDLHNSPL